MGCGNDAHIYLCFLHSTHWEKFFVIQNRKKFNLKRQRQISNFREEDGSILGQPEETGLIFYCSGKSTPDMAKQFGLEQGLRQSTAIDFYKGVT